MTVKELIAELLQCPQKNTVIVEGYAEWEDVHYSGNVDEIVLDLNRKDKIILNIKE